MVVSCALTFYRVECCILLVLVLLIIVVSARDLGATTTAARKFWWHERTRAPQIHGVLKSIPAFSRQGRSDDSSLEIEDVAVKAKRPKESSNSLPFFRIDPAWFMGTTPQTVLSASKQERSKPPAERRLDLREGMSEALLQLKSMRSEMEQMRAELRSLKQLQMGEDYIDEEATHQSKNELARRQRDRQRDFDKLGTEVEQWAEKLLFPQEEDDEVEGWSPVSCNKMLKDRFNKEGRTQAFLKWMKDSRGTSYITKDEDTKPDEQEWPCIRLYSTIDAPCREVCLYLSDSKHFTEYNSLLDAHKDLEEVTSYSKICWAQSPQVLFIKPRDFVTFCSHRWRRDGTQVLVNQACDKHEDITANAFALRGATFIGSDPNDPEKTRIAMLVHASPGKDIPHWASKTAIKSLAPIEPFRLFHKINEAVVRNRSELRARCSRLHEVEMASNSTERNSRSPAGLAGMGFGCFWPEGGGEKELKLIDRKNENDDSPQLAHAGDLSTEKNLHE